MKVTIPSSIIAISILAIAATIAVNHGIVSATASDPSIGPSPPFYFSSVGGFPTPTTFNGQPALKLMPATGATNGGVAYDALKFAGQPVGVSMVGGYTVSGGIGVADGFTIVMFANNGTFSGSPISYGNFSIPRFLTCSSTGICGNVVIPNSVSPYVALQWNPFYGMSAQFNLWVVNPPGSVVANPGSIGCSIGVPAAGDLIRFNSTYTPTGNMLQASVADLTSGANCGFSVALGPFGFSSPSPGTYWAMVEADSGAGTADWTILHVQISGRMITVSKFFTDSSLNPLPLDSQGNPKVDVVLAGSTVRSTNPGQVLAWVNVTNTSGSSVQSLRLNETLPVDWAVDPPWMPGLGGIHVFFANTTSLSTNPEITQPSAITVSAGNPEVVHVSISNVSATGIGHPLLAGQSILLSVKLSYALMGTSQSASSYPRNYTDTAAAAAWTQPSFTGSKFTGTAAAFFTADAKVVADITKPPGHASLQ